MKSMNGLTICKSVLSDFVSLFLYALPLLFLVLMFHPQL